MATLEDAMCVLKLGFAMNAAIFAQDQEALTRLQATFEETTNSITHKRLLLEQEGATRSTTQDRSLFLLILIIMMLLVFLKMNLRMRMKWLRKGKRTCS